MGKRSINNNLNESSPYEDHIVLSTLSLDGRDIAYSTAGDPRGTPVLFFYPGGGNRRMLVTLHDVAVSSALKLICVNRPGRGGTSVALESDPAIQVSTVCNDAIAVLNALHISRVSLLFMCAGTPFALAFATKFSKRISGKLMGVSSWAQPADCSCHDPIKRFGAVHCPLWLLGPLVGNVMGSMVASITSLPTSIAVSGLTKKLTEWERDIFFEGFEEDKFMAKTAWMFQEGGGLRSDISVLFSKGEDLGIDFGQISGDVSIFHGEEDRMVPVAAGEWLARQFGSADFIRLPDGSHEGVSFLLHLPVSEALKKLGEAQRKSDFFQISAEIGT